MWTHHVAIHGRARKIEHERRCAVFQKVCSHNLHITNSFLNFSNPICLEADEDKLELNFELKPSEKILSGITHGISLMSVVVVC